MHKADLALVIKNFLPILNSKTNLSGHKLRVLDALQKCRTQYMGGHIEACDICGEVRTMYNSCRNRHCPQCGAIDKERWIINREQDLLPVKYFHVVFTIPDKLNLLFINNQQQMYNLLFTTAWNTLASFGKTKKWVGGKLGATAILHTWGQNLSYHPHLHFIIPAGALQENGLWKSSKSNGKYLFSTRQLSSVFRAKFVEAARAKLRNKEIKGRVPNNLFLKDWVVYAKRPFGGPKNVINYLGRYTHRTAISNDRILSVTKSEVSFAWRDYKHDSAKRITSIKGEDFLALFCQHILPTGFTRIRHYGFLSSASKNKSLALIRSALNVIAPAELSKEEKTTKALQNMGIQHGICKCGGKMHIIKTIANKFRKGSRAPPYRINIAKLNNSISEY